MLCRPVPARTDSTHNTPISPFLLGVIGKLPIPTPTGGPVLTQVRSQELRRRNNNQNNSNNNDGTAGTLLFAPIPAQYAAGLRVPNLLKGHPQHSGSVYKLHVPFLFLFLPRFLQQWLIQKLNNIDKIENKNTTLWLYYFLASWLLPKWESRFIILVGRYLYKFVSSINPKAPPKGRPIAVISANIFLLSKNDMECIQTHNNMMTAALLLGPPQPQPLLQESLSSYHIFAVSSSSSSVYHSNNHQKTQYFCVPGPIEEAQAWVNALHQAQEDGIRRELGHVPKDSYPSAWKHFDTLGDGLVQTQDRLERHMAATKHSQTAMLFPELELSPTTTSVGVGGVEAIMDDLYMYMEEAITDDIYIYIYICCKWNRYFSSF